MPRKAAAKPFAAAGRKRSDLIRLYATQMRALLDERNYCNVRIRDLHAAIRKELGVPRDDFITAMRLQTLASENREQTVANIRDVLTALGSVMPTIEPPSGDENGGGAAETTEQKAGLRGLVRPAHPFDPPAAQILRLLSETSRPMKAAEIATTITVTGGVKAVGCVLSHLKRKQLVTHLSESREWAIR